MSEFGGGMKRQDARDAKGRGVLNFFYRRKRRGPIEGIFKRGIGWAFVVSG
jgi:hypothetical protein